MQKSSSHRWARRRVWLQSLLHAAKHKDVVAVDVVKIDSPVLGVASGVSKGVAAVGESDLVALLLDQRLVQSRGSLISSPIIGTTIPFLSGCCDDPECVNALPYDAMPMLPVRVQPRLEDLPQGGFFVSEYMTP